MIKAAFDAARGVPTWEEIEELRRPQWERHLEYMSAERGQAVEEFIDEAKLEEKQRYRQVRQEVLSLGGTTAWRAVTGVNPLEWTNLGIYWTSTKSKAEPYYDEDRHGKAIHVFRASIPPESIDYRETLLAKMNLTFDEDEVRLVPSAPVFLFDMEYLGKIIPVNEWRYA